MVTAAADRVIIQVMGFILGLMCKEGTADEMYG